MTEYPATALEDITSALLTALKAIISKDEGANLHGQTVEELLINVVNLHPEPTVANWARSEIHRLFVDFQEGRPKDDKDRDNP